MKNKNKFVIGLILIAIGIIGILGLFSNTSDKYDLFCGSALLIVGGLVLIYFDCKKQKLNLNIEKFTQQQNTAPVQNPAVPPVSKETESIPDGERNYNLFDDVTDGAVLCYEYEESLCLLDEAFSYILGNGGKPLIFKQEPENPHDEKAVAIYLNGVKIGFVYRGTIQNMVNDYIKRGWRVAGYLNKYSINNSKATYKIGFYKPLQILDSKTFSLTKVKKKIDEFTNRADNLSECEEGDILTVEYYDSEDSYIVFNDVYEEIGELPKSAAEFIMDDSYKKIVGILNQLKVDENGVSGAYVTIYLVK